jgi:hemolysin activation/secretion protein
VSRNISTGDLATDSPRVGAKNDYSVLHYGGNIYISVAQDWTVHAGVNGQYTRDALPSGDQFGIGGASSVRGYEERALSNDSGVTATLETYTPEVAQHFGWNGISLRGLLFGDYGRVTRNLALPGEMQQAELAGAGMGMRLDIGKTASVKLDVARAIRDGGGAKEGDVRAHVVATVSY